MYQINGELPNLFLRNNGEAVTTSADWLRQRNDLLGTILSIEYGHLPPTPTKTYAEVLPEDIRPASPDVDRARYRIVAEGGASPFSFFLNVLTPPGDGPFPVVINGDGCWHYVTPEVEKTVVERGYILATFDRTEIVPDTHRTEENQALYSVYPEGDYGALAAWAWGYHRVVDIVGSLAKASLEQIAIVGHSRGGKATLLAGATDERIALTSTNNSGCGGAGSFSVQGDGCEKLENILGMFPYWFSARLRDFIGRDSELPFDQHALKATVAPRALLTTEALGDAWANPIGTYQTHLAASEVYRFLGAADRIGIHYREGGHAHNLDDWKTLLDFADRTFRDQDPGYSFAASPFAKMPRAFTWSAP